MIPKKSTPIKNEILIDIFAKGKLSQSEMRIVAYIIRWSWGFDGIEERQNWTKKISKTQMARDIRMDHAMLGRILNIMIKEEKILEKNKQYQFNEHYDKWKINNTKRGISKLLRDKVFERDDYICQYCKKSNWKDGIKLEVDHIIPISKGGTDDINNLVTSCRKCNREKGSKIYVDNKSINGQLVHLSEMDKKSINGGQKNNNRWIKSPPKMDKKSTSVDLKPLQDKPLPDRKETPKDNKETLKGENLFKNKLSQEQIERNKKNITKSKNAFKDIVNKKKEVIK